MPKVSIVIPVFNTAKYLKKCIFSIWEQKCDVQIIAVNDASTDNSLSVLNNLKTSGIPIEIIDLKKNLGVESARFLGIKQARGEYIMFVDSDDYLPKNAIATLVEAIRIHKADIVQGGYRRVLDNWGWISKKSVFPCDTFPVVISQPELYNRFYISFFGGKGLSVSLWGKIYRRELFENKVLIKTGFRFGEDAILNMRIFPNLNKYVVLPDIVYCYRYGGMTSNYKPWLWNELKIQYKYRLSFLDSKINSKEIAQIKSEMVSNFIGVITSMYRHKISEEQIISLYTSELLGGARVLRAEA